MAPATNAKVANVVRAAARPWLNVIELQVRARLATATVLGYERAAKAVAPKNLAPRSSRNAVLSLGCSSGEHADTFVHADTFASESAFFGCGGANSCAGTFASESAFFGCG